MNSIASIAPIVLAAGDSTRMGYPKALLPLGTDIFLTRILRTISRVGLGRPTIVLGRAAPSIEPKILGRQADIVINPDPGRGQLSSIQLGLSNLPPEAGAAMIWPVDQPLVSEDLVQRLAQLFLESGALIACPRCGDKRGHPAIFHRSLFQEFMDAPLEDGPKNLVVLHQPETAVLATDEIAAVMDMDTPSDYKALTGEDLKIKKFTDSIDPKGF
jgi:molybdenum cofactor cytidylyltransferase